MSFLQKKRYKIPEDDSDPMLPFMSLLLIIIPVLIGNIAFYHFKAIELNTPGVSKNENSNEDVIPEEEDKNKDVKAIIKTNINTVTEIELELINEDTGDTLEIKSFPLTPDMNEGEEEVERVIAQINEVIQSYKKLYPRLDAMLLSIDRSLNYQDILPMISILQSSIEEKKRDEGDGVDVKKILTMVLIPTGSSESEES